MLLHLAAALYGLNLLVGLAAQLGGVGFGRWHHALYALVFASAIAALVREFHPGLLLTVVALAALPRSRPGTWRHPALAALGGLGHVAALLLD